LYRPPIEKKKDLHTHRGPGGTCRGQALTENQREKKVLELPIAPKAKNYADRLARVEDKILAVSDEICWRCYQNFDSHCMAYLVAGSDEEQKYRMLGNALCEFVKWGRPLPIAGKLSGIRPPPG